MFVASASVFAESEELIEDDRSLTLVLPMAAAEATGMLRSMLTEAEDVSSRRRPRLRTPATRDAASRRRRVDVQLLIEPVAPTGLQAYH